MTASKCNSRYCFDSDNLFLQQCCVVRYNKSRQLIQNKLEQIPKILQNEFIDKMDIGTYAEPSPVSSIHARRQLFAELCYVSESEPVNFYMLTCRITSWEKSLLFKLQASHVGASRPGQGQRPSVCLRFFILSKNVIQ